MGMIHVSAAQDARQLESQLHVNLDCPEDVLYGELTPGLSVHSGSGLIGTAFVIGE